ncbi:hypothetical protein ES705_33135 [subsurface metagenome]
MNDSLNIKELKVGMRITLISRGIQRSEHHPDTWIDQQIKGTASFFEITRVGTKYIYGFGFYYEPETKKHEKAHFEDKRLTSDFVIVLGFDVDAKIRHNVYMKAIRAHEEKEHKAEYEIDHKMREVKAKLQADWRKENPSPKPLTV